METFPIAKDDTVEVDEDGNIIEEGGDDGAFLGAAISPGSHTVKAVYRAPGQILGLTKTGLKIACGEGAVEVISLQAEGGKRMAAPDYFRGHPLN